MTDIAAGATARVESASAWHPIAKAALPTTLATIASFAASAFILRKSPLRAIV